MRRSSPRARRLLAGLALAGLLAGFAGGCANEPEPIIIETPAPSVDDGQQTTDDRRPATEDDGPRASAGTPSPTRESTPRPPAPPARININTADTRALEALPRIGPATARRIVDYRQSHGPFKTIDDLLDVPGIGPATLDAIRALVAVGD